MDHKYPRAIRPGRWVIAAGVCLAASWGCFQAALSGWDILGATLLINGNFESGPGIGWLEYSGLGYQLVLNQRDFPEGVYPHGGNYAAWLGGDNNEQAYLLQLVDITGLSSNLVYWRWVDSEDSCGWDYGYILLDDDIVDIIPLCIAKNTAGWIKSIIDLSTYTGQSPELKIMVETDSSNPSSLYVDDVSVEPSVEPTAPGNQNWIYLPYIIK